MFRDCFDVTRSPCVVTQRLPDFPQSRRPKALSEIDERIRRPKLAAYVLAADYFAGAV
jgi:hypothetical protein